MGAIDGVRSAGSARVLLSFARARGLAEPVLLRGTGLRDADLADPLAEIRTEHELRLIENLVRAVPEEPALGLAAGRCYSVGLFGMLGFALMSSPSLTSALELGFRYRDLAFSLVDVALHRGPDATVLVLDADHLPRGVRRFALDHEIAVLWTVFAGLSGRVPHAFEARLGFAANDVGPYEELFGTRTVAGCARTEVLLNTTDMEARLPQADEAALQLCEAQCAALRERRRALVGVTGLVYERLARAAGGPPPASIVARDLHLSQRSLRRRLTSEGSSFRSLDEQVRRRRAEELLTDSELTVAAIAGRLGYATTSAFTHAFKRWAGVTPSAFRAARAG